MVRSHLFLVSTCENSASVACVVSSLTQSILHRRTFIAMQGLLSLHVMILYVLPYMW